MNFSINEFGDRPNGRKSWDQLSEGRKRKLRKLHNDTLDRMVNTSQNQLTVEDNHSVNNNVDSEKIAHTVDITKNNCHTFFNQEEKISSDTNNDRFFNANNNNLISDSNVSEVSLESKNQNQNSKNNFNQNFPDNINTKSAKVDANTNGTKSEELSLECNNRNPCNVKKISYDEETFKQKLAKCIIDNKINLTQSKALLKVLRTHPNFTFLPKDSRSLLNTPRQKITTKIVPPGEYLHIGLELMLQFILSRVNPDSIPDELKIDFSTDGAEANSKIQMWPIQVRIINVPYDKPELVGVYTGESKPSSFAEFLSDFIEEVNQINFKGGISYENKLIPVQVRCFIADAPARAYVLNHKTHIAEYPCSRC